MSPSLIAAVITHTFGRHATKPRPTAWRRLLFAFCIATALDVIITQSLGTLRLPPDLFQSWITLMLVLAVQIIVGIVMLIVRASGYGLHDDQVNDILSILPVSEPARWIAGLLPGLCAIGMLFVLAIGPLIVIASILRLQWYLFALGLSVGIVSGIGLGTYQPHRSIAVNFVLMTALVAVELQLLERMMTLYQIYQNPFIVGFATLLICILIPFYWLHRSMLTWSQVRQMASRGVYMLRILPTHISNWFSHKIIRHPKILRSTIVLTGISSLVAALWLQAGGGKDPELGTALIGLSFIASLAASDIRSLTRPKAAPEMIMVKGSRHFVAQQVFFAFIICCLVTTPLWLSVIVTHSAHVSTYTAVLGQLALGCTIALLASTLFVPSQQDISAEFFGAVISTCLIIALEKLTASLKIAGTLKTLSLLWIGLSIVIGGLIFSVERRRNNYYWKENKQHA